MKQNVENLQKHKLGKNESNITDLQRRSYEYWLSTF